MTKLGVYCSVSYLLATILSAQNINPVAAYVNEEVITVPAVNELVQQEGLSYADAREQLIEQQLLLQDFNARKGKIPAIQLEAQMASMVQENFNGNRRALLQALKTQGSTLHNLQDNLKQAIIFNAMRQQKCHSEYAVSPKKIRTYYETHTDDFRVPASYHIVQSGFDENAKVSNSEVKKSDKLQELLKEKVPFDAIKKQLNDFTVGATWYSEKELDKNLVTLLRTMPVHTATPYLNLNNVFVTIELLDKKSDTIRPLSEVQKEIEERLQMEANDKSYREYIEYLKSKAIIRRNPEHV